MFTICKSCHEVKTCGKVRNYIAINRNFLLCLIRFFSLWMFEGPFCPCLSNPLFPPLPQPPFFWLVVKLLLAWLPGFQVSDMYFSKGLILGLQKAILLCLYVCKHLFQMDNLGIVQDLAFVALCPEQSRIFLKTV